MSALLTLLERGFCCALAIWVVGWDAMCVAKGQWFLGGGFWSSAVDAVCVWHRGSGLGGGVEVRLLMLCVWHRGSDNFGGGGFRSSAVDAVCVWHRHPLCQKPRDVLLLCVACCDSAWLLWLSQ
jgi:hypothetical protein